MVSWRNLCIGIDVTVSLFAAADARAQRCGQEVVLIDRIGPDSSWTDGNIGFTSSRYPAVGAWKIAPVVITPLSCVTLATFRWIGFAKASTNGQVSWPNFYYELKIWSSLVTATQSPLSGDILNIPISPVATLPSVFGAAPPGSGFTLSTYDMSFDISPFDINLSAGEDYVLGVFENSNWVVDGFWKVSESDQVGASDTWITYDTGVQTASNVSGGSGRFAIKITGSIADISGDMNGDGEVDGLDIAYFSSAVLNASTNSLDLCVGDFSGNDVIDAGDINGFVSKVLGP